MPSAWDGLKNCREITELPHYAVNKTLPADSYFTSPETAQRCWEAIKSVVPVDECHFLEPSAGAGAFYDLLPSDRRVALDLYHTRDDFEHADFLQWWPKSDAPSWCVVGNPPFGVRGATALAFVNRAFLFADWVAFILPMSFHSNGKGSNMKRVKGAHLVFSETWEGERFYSPDSNKQIKVNTLFQIWKRGEGESIFPDLDVSDWVDVYTVCSSPNRLCGMDKLDLYDFYVSSSYYGDELHTVYTFDEVKYGSGYGCVIKQNREEIMDWTRTVNWNDWGSLATNSAKHVRKYSIEQALYSKGWGRRK